MKPQKHPSDKADSEKHKGKMKTYRILAFNRALIGEFGCTMKAIDDKEAKRLFKASNKNCDILCIWQIVRPPTPAKAARKAIRIGYHAMPAWKPTMKIILPNEQPKIVL